MRWIKFDPITLKRIDRFRRIKRGYYSLIILAVLTVPIDLRSIPCREPASDCLV